MAEAIQGLLMLALLVAMLFFEFTRPIAIWIFVALGVVLFVGFIYGTHQNEKKQRELEMHQLKHQGNLKSAEDRIYGIVSDHIKTLATRRDTLVRADRYGVADGKAWNAELQHFIDKVIRPKLTDEESQAVAEEGLSSVFQRHIEDRVRDYCASRPPVASIPDGTSPSDFEGLCAATLRSVGWHASTTKGSGDQGADVIASFNDKKLVLQCKLYSGTVGNKAIQEVLAAKAFYNAQIGAVVSRTEFTKSAKELANVSGISLIQFGELEEFGRAQLDARTSERA